MQQAQMSQTGLMEILLYNLKKYITNTGEQQKTRQKHEQAFSNFVV